jgi:hypothetical protein
VVEDMLVGMVGMKVRMVVGIQEGMMEGRKVGMVVDIQEGMMADMMGMMIQKKKDR